jgi:hypothetical protein
LGLLKIEKIEDGKKGVPRLIPVSTRSGPKLEFFNSLAYPNCRSPVLNIESLVGNLAELE